MTAKQKANALRFKKAIAEAKKLRAKNPKLSQAQAVKQAWAILYKGGNVGDYKLNNTEFVENRIPISPRKKTLKKKKEFAVLREYDGTFKKIKRISGVKTATKKTAKKKATAKSYHKDTKSHNVNIRVVSGIGDMSKALVKRLNEVIDEIERREGVIINVMKNKKELIARNGKAWYPKWIKDDRKIVTELKAHKTELKRLI